MKSEDKWSEIGSLEMKKECIATLSYDERYNNWIVEGVTEVQFKANTILEAKEKAEIFIFDMQQRYEQDNEVRI